MSDTQQEGQLLDKSQEKLKHPRRFTVIIHNDDYTTQEFVVFILTDIFKLSQAKAFETMMKVHKEGLEKVGDYSFDVAHTKAVKAQNISRANEFPLKCTVEPISGD